MTAAAVRGNAVLFSEMTPPPGGEAAFNEWYDTHHTPNHVRGVPGFLSAQRYAAADGPGYCAVYELDGAETLEGPEYRARKYAPDPRTRAMLASVTGFTRYVGAEIDRRGGAPPGFDADRLLAVFLAAGMENESDIQERAGWRMTRLFRVVRHDPRPFALMALHYFARLEAVEARALVRAHTPAPCWVLYRKRGARFLKPGPAGARAGLHEGETT